MVNPRPSIALLSVTLIVILSSLIINFSRLVPESRRDDSRAPITTPPPLDASFWQTYFNSQFNFQIKYPQNWFISNNLQRELDDQSFAIEFTDVDQTFKVAPPNKVSLYINEEPCTENANEPAPSWSESGQTLSKTICKNPLRITLQLQKNSPNRLAHQQTLDQILSTFKFQETCAGENNLPCPAGFACKLNVRSKPALGGICVHESETNP